MKHGFSGNRVRSGMQLASTGTEAGGHQE